MDWSSQSSRMPGRSQGVTFGVRTDVVLFPRPSCGSPNAKKMEEEFCPSRGDLTPVEMVHYSCADCGASR